MTHQIRLVEANFDGMQCRTGRDGGPTCKEYRELYRRSWLFGREIVISACHHYNWELERFDGEKRLIVKRCIGCVRDFGTDEHDGLLERFDVPIQKPVVPTSELSRFSSDAPLIRNSIRAVDRPTSMLRPPKVRNTEEGT